MKLSQKSGVIVMRIPKNIITTSMKWSLIYACARNPTLTKLLTTMLTEQNLPAYASKAAPLKMALGKNEDKKTTESRRHGVEKNTETRKTATSAAAAAAVCSPVDIRGRGETGRCTISSFSRNKRERKSKSGEAGIRFSRTSVVVDLLRVSVPPAKRVVKKDWPTITSSGRAGARR